MVFTIDSIHDGDILKILGEDENSRDEIWYAEKVGVTGEYLLVCYIQKTDTPSIWKFEEVHRDVPIECVLEVCSSVCEETQLLDVKEYRRSWKCFGFRLLDENTLYELNGPAKTIWLGDYDSDSSGSDVSMEEESTDTNSQENKESELEWKSELEHIVVELSKSRLRNL